MEITSGSSREPPGSVGLASELAYRGARFVDLPLELDQPLHLDSQVPTDLLDMGLDAAEQLLTVRARDDRRRRS